MVPDGQSSKSTNFAFRFSKTIINMTEKKRMLFRDFAPVNTTEWEAIIESDLKGKDYEKALVWKTYEGFSVQPYYRSENLNNLNFLNSLPGEFPFIRGNNKTGNDW